VIVVILVSGDLCSFARPRSVPWIFMRGDFDAIVAGDIRRLIWTEDQEITGEIRLRLLNALLAKYVIGAGRWLVGRSREGNARRDWLQTWEQNNQAGATSSARALRAARDAAVAAIRLLTAVAGIDSSCHRIFICTAS
jgi:hypothetical protein